MIARLFAALRALVVGHRDAKPDNVIEPHRQGPVRCLACLHEWRAVRPLWTRAADLVCPSCRSRGAVELG